MIKNKGFPFSVYSKLYQACVCSISNYGAEIFGYGQYNSKFKLYLRAIRAFHGMPEKVPTFGLISEVDWLLPHYEAQIKMTQFYAKLLSTQEMDSSGQVLSSGIWVFGVYSTLSA